MEAAFQLERAKSEEPSGKREDVGADLLDSLVHMSIEKSTRAEPLVAEQMTYTFEQKLPVEDAVQRPAADMFTRESDQRRFNSAGRQRETEDVLAEEKQTNSEIASTHGSESAAGMRSVDRMERKSNFSVLQEHINQLTEENCDLKRGLELQQRLTANLTSENQTLGDEYNIQAQKLEEIQKKCNDYESLLREQQEMLESLHQGHELSRAAEQSSKDRVKELVQENVALEDRLRDTRVSEIRLEKTVEKLKEDIDVLTKQERKSENENRNLTDILNNIREENNVLRAQMHAPNERTSHQPGTMPLGSGQMDVKRPVLSISMKDAEVQVDALEEITHPSMQQPLLERKDRDSADFGKTFCGTEVQESVILSDEEVLQSLVSREQSQLTSEESLVLTSVHELINALDDQRKAMIAKLRAAKVEISKLKAENQTLVQKVSSQTQVLEMYIQREVNHQLAESSQTQQPQSTPLKAPSNYAQTRDTRVGLFSWLGGKTKEENVRDYMT